MLNYVNIKNVQVILNIGIQEEEDLNKMITLFLADQYNGQKFNLSI